ncbi:helix-turn-helix domain-containing protein [Aerococcus urinaeequi]|uniref:helix-turn-helix domain-containing protein n=1 Tax=Aerococcus urinaeequi TaxID=51665 RepID=UPI000845E5EB|nr:helix-turn-helix transcriptional regulator [Aerococcus urinaeequi]
MNNHELRKIRENKGLSLSQLSHNIMSDSQLSKFERNETNITYDKFLLLLDRLEITMEEYLYLSKDDSLYSTEALIEKIKTAYRGSVRKMRIYNAKPIFLTNPSFLTTLRKF